MDCFELNADTAGTQTIRGARGSLRGWAVKSTGAGELKFLDGSKVIASVIISSGGSSTFYCEGINCNDDLKVEIVAGTITGGIYY